METSYVIAVLMSVASMYFWYDKKKADKDLGDYKSSVSDKFKLYDAIIKEIDNKQTEHDNKFVTDQRVRDIVKDEIRPIKEDVAQMKHDVAIILQNVGELTTEIKIQNALRDYETKNGKPPTGA